MPTPAQIARMEETQRRAAAGGNMQVANALAKKLSSLTSVSTGGGGAAATTKYGGAANANKFNQDFQLMPLEQRQEILRGEKPQQDNNDKALYQTPGEKANQLGEDLFGESDLVETSIEEKVRKLKEKQLKETQALQAANENQAQLDRNATAETMRGIYSGVEGARSSFSQGREGPRSEGAPQAFRDFQAVSGKKIEDADLRLTSANNRRAQLEEQLAEAQRGQRTAEVIDIQNAISQVETEKAKAEKELLDSQRESLDFALKSDQQKFDNKTKTLEVMKGLVSSGIALSPDLMLNFAAQTGLPVESLMTFNQQAEQIRADKTLDQGKKTAELQKLGFELDRQMRGITNTELEKVDFLQNMYRNGSSQEEIAQVKRFMGIKDEDDPMYRADLAYKQSQTAYQNSQTQENYAKMKEAQLQYDNLTGGGGGAYVPTKPIEGVEVAYKDGKLDIKCDIPMQCGEFVNRTWGLSSSSGGGMGDTAKEKRKLVDENGISKSQVNLSNFTTLVRPGMAFVSMFGDTDHGGIVTAVYPDGTFSTKEANVGDKDVKNPDPPIPKTRSIKDADLYGFAYPPEGTAKLEGGGSGDPMVDAQVEAILSSTSRTTAGLSTKDNFRGRVDQALAKKQEDLREAGDVRGYLLASAGGSKPSDNFLQSFTKGKVVVNQLMELANALAKTGDFDSVSEMKDEEGRPWFDTNPVLGWLASKDPWNTDAQEINAIIQGAIPTLARGIYGEVGVLTDKDIELYRRTLPNLSQTGQVQKAVAGLTARVIRNSLLSSLETQAQNGRNVRGNVTYLDELDKKIEQIETSLGIKTDTKPQEPPQWVNWLQKFSGQAEEPDNDFASFDVTSGEDILNEFQ